MSMRARVAMIVAVVLAVIVLIVGVIVVRATSATLQEQVDAQVLETAAKMKPSYGGPSGYGGYGGRNGDRNGTPPPQYLSGSEEPDDEPHYRAVAQFVYASDGTILKSEPCGYSDDPSSPPSIQIPGDDLDERLDTISTVPAEDGSLDYRLLVQQDDQDNYVVTAAPLDDAQAAVERLTRTMVLAGVAGVALAGLASWALISRQFRPVDRMIDTAAAIGEGNLGERVPEPQAGTELGRLSRALNAMLGRIQRSSEAQVRSESRLRQFIADAAHELRSPLTSVRGYAELYRQGAIESPEQVSHAMRRIEGEGERMGRLLEEMLLLARLDQRVERVHEPVDLSAVTEEALDAFTTIQPERPLAIDIVPGVVIDGDAVNIRQVIDNLLANIRVHTPPGTPASVTLRRDGTAAELRVHDDGPGIDETFQPHVFERFTREDPARTRSTGGSGLGLAIVAALVEAHHGTIRVESEAGQGATFIVRLPIIT